MTFLTDLLAEADRRIVALSGIADWREPFAWGLGFVVLVAAVIVGAALVVRR